MKKIEQEENGRQEKQHQATLKRLKRGDENELDRKLRLDTATKRLRLAIRKRKTGEDGSYRAAQFGHGDVKERKARLQKMVATTQLRLALETEEERRARLKHLSEPNIYT